MAEELILRLKKKRAINRSYLTKTCNKIESGLDTLMRIELEELLEQLNESFNELILVDHEIETLLETDDLEKELQGVEEYREKYITWRFRANKKIRQSDFHGENIPNSNSRIDENEMRHYVPSCTTVKLPKLMISKFYGNFSEWLTFWNSFDAAIHQNNSLNPIDKFNYLKSHLGGTALNTVEGFALSADNYEKAIKLLKDRFGREDILISRHMNNLLSISPLKTSSDVRTFRELFGNLSVQIRSLESLNVSIDVYGQLLCPIIIKLLPADLNLELNKELPTGYVINDLITFLERQLTAREKSFRNEIGTGNESTSKPNLVNKHPNTRFYNEKPIATASELLNSVHKTNECVFCGKDNHGSPKCDFAANMSLNEKRSLMKKKGVCYKCLRPSHLSKFCRNVVRCSICNMSSHLDVMCTKLILDRGGSSKSPTVQDETLANLSTSPDVLLPTLRVTLKGNRTEKTARAIIDTGSQDRIFYIAQQWKWNTNNLGESSSGIPCLEDRVPTSFFEGSEELDVSDLMRDRIEVLIGADIAGRLLTDDQRRISSGLVAIRTKLGWTVMGKIPPTEMRDDTSSLCVTTLLSLDLENLWKLDAIGVSDAEVEKKTQSLQAEMEEHFAHTTTRDIEGRYEVALPLVQDKERIPSNRDLAENQQSSERRKLEEVGNMNEYGQIFEEWMKQGIIEYAREDKLDGVHYLPHRPVYKRNSQTSRIRPVFNASARKRGKLSLNDCLDKGPNLIEIIPRLLNKFRKYEVGVSSDIEKAFLQIGIKEEDRDAAVFEIAGVDLTGHFILKNKKKAWIVIFTCAVYRGVHLELVTSLPMEAFLQALRRFIARRSRQLIVYSDNGTNFKGMANTLKKFDFSRLKCDPTLKNITWKFIPPGAPWWGGWWERLIGMMKQLLFRILGQTSLGYEELSTVMCDVESLMNTRPLTYLTEESEDLALLTPSLFLHEVREVGVPDLDLIDNQTLSRKYQYIKRVREDLRERFRIEYFGFLRQETRRLKTTIPFKVGDMVLIGQESLKRLHWPLARIIQLYPGKDGLVRVAKVKTSSGDKIRPIQKLYNLEITPEIRCRDPLTERSPTQEVRLTTEEDPLTSQQEQHHIETPNVVSSYGRPIKRPNRLDLLNFSFPCFSRRDANSKVGEMLEKKPSEAANGRPAEAATGMQRQKEKTITEELVNNFRTLEFALISDSFSDYDGGQWTKDYGRRRGTLRERFCVARHFHPAQRGNLDRLTDRGPTRSDGTKCLCPPMAPIRRKTSSDNGSRPERHRVQVCEAPRAPQCYERKNTSRVAEWTRHLPAARVQEPSEWYKITTQLKLSTNKEEEPQQPSTSTSTPVKKFNSNSSKAHQYQPSPRTAAATHHQQEPYKSINQPPYPCKICASHQLPNQIHFHRDCPLKNNNHPKRTNPDASSLGVAGVLKQPDEQGILHPIGYFSRKLHPYEQNYTASEIETLAIINSVQRIDKTNLESARERWVAKGRHFRDHDIPKGRQKGPARQHLGTILYTRISRQDYDGGQWTKDYGRRRGTLRERFCVARHFHPAQRGDLDRLTDRGPPRSDGTKCLCPPMAPIRRKTSSDNGSRPERHRVQVCEAPRSPQR
ncbi:hypothetical protein LAZ67_6003135 [Cordylochernes scorpioides]|uniref:Integrase catalytic domain-containing protein n=1 Tax=Cordylochernes scorpioides TaxID=51811 RepID=A0ABY6KKQ6_9ARAC|nr:hypothetical protein LAZ67_6003135 [Cordylochernes scorpioides]